MCASADSARLISAGVSVQRVLYERGACMGAATCRGAILISDEYDRRTLLCIIADGGVRSGGYVIDRVQFKQVATLRSDSKLNGYSHRPVVFTDTWGPRPDTQTLAWRYASRGLSSIRSAC
jgi:hypothetical protein